MSNILSIEGAPFAEPVVLFRYDLESELQWDEFQWRIKSLRAVKGNRRNPIVQDYRSVISPTPVLNDDRGSLDLFVKPVTFECRADDEHGLRLLRRLVGEAIAVHLRNYVKTLWLVEEVANSVFDVSDSRRISIGNLELFKGFRYAPIVLRNGQVGVVVDPKHKFRSSKTLRDYYDEGVDPRKLADQEMSPFVDACPVRECPEKLNPFSLCRLAGTGRTLYFEDVEQMRPSEWKLPFDDKPNLIEYSRRARVCPMSPMLADAIRDAPPIAQMRFHENEIWDYEQDPYSYALERIRIRPSLQDMSPDERRRIMEMIQPKPDERFELTEYFGDKIGRVSLPGRPDLVSGGFREPWQRIQTAVYKRVEPIVGQSRPARIPSLALPEFGPVDLGNKRLDLIPLLVVWGSEPTTDERATIRALLDSSGSMEVPSFSEYVKGRTTKVVGEVVVDDAPEKTIKRIESIVKEKHVAAVLLCCDYGENAQSRRCNEVTRALVFMDIPKQGLNLSLLENKIQVSQKPYFRNVYLGLYAKVGGVPWMLPGAEDSRTVFVGYSSLTRSGYTRFVLCSYSNTGRFLGGVYRVSDRDAYESDLHKNLIGLIGNAAERCVVLAKGGLYGFEYTVLRNLDWRGNLLAVECVDSPLRLYGFKSGRAYAPQMGSSVIVSDTEIGLVTTGPATGTPSPILLRLVLGDQTTFRKLIQPLLDLTQCYTGYSKATIKYPVPVHASARALNKAQELKLDAFDFKVAWFV